MSYESDFVALDQIRICENELKRLENNRDSMDPEYYSRAKEDLEYELNCWRSQLEFGTANAWYL